MPNQLVNSVKHKTIFHTIPPFPPPPKWWNSELGGFHQGGFKIFNKGNAVETFWLTYSYWEVFVEVHRNKNIYKV